MQVKLNVLNESANEFGYLKTQLESIAEELNRIISKYGDITCFQTYANQMHKERKSIQEQGKYCGQFKAALEGIRNIYEQCESGIIDKCEEVQGQSIEAEVVQENLSGLSVEMSELLKSGKGTENTELYMYSDEVLDMLKDMKSQMGTIEDISEIYAMFGGESEFVKVLGEYAEKVGGLNILKTAGYLGDCSSIVEALESGDTEKIEKLLVKYGKKGMGKLLKSATGVSGITGSTYISLGVNAGENLIEEVIELYEEPSLGSLAGAVWGVTGGAMWDAGAELAKDGLELFYAIGGKEFDEADFDMAMDFVGNAMESLVEGVADGIAGIGAAAMDTAAGIAGAAWEGVCNMGKTVASWFEWF